MLNIESGLNDGIATPIVLVAIAGVAAEADIEALRDWAGRPWRFSTADVHTVTTGVLGWPRY